MIILLVGSFCWSALERTFSTCALSIVSDEAGMTFPKVFSITGGSVVMDNNLLLCNWSVACAGIVEEDVEGQSVIPFSLAPISLGGYAAGSYFT